jgi:superfamily II helicase
MIAQKQIGWTIAVDILPKFLSQFKSKISLLVPADEQFTLKSAMSEEDKTILTCEHCLVKFTVTTRRNYCRYCGLVYCNPCVSKLCTLPPQFGVGTTKVRYVLFALLSSLY